MEQLELAREGVIKVLYLVGENPIGTLPSSSNAREAIERAEFVVCQDLFLTETGRMSDVVLPAASYAEQDGHFTNNEGRVQKVRKAYDPIRDVRPDWEIFSQIAGYMGAYFEYGGEDEITAEIQKLIPGWKSMPPLSDREAAMERFLANGSAVPLEQRYRVGRSKPPKGKASFSLSIGPTLFHSGKMSLESEGLRKIADEGRLRMNPVDAAELGVEDGGRVIVRSALGEAVVKVKLDGRYSPHCVYFPDSFNEPAIKDLFPVETDPITRVPYFKIGEVDIVKWIS